jgi:hypothetical protein
MATNPRDNFINGLRSQQNRNNFAHKTDGTADYNQADLLYWDSSAKVVKALDSDAHAATLVGVALRSAFIAPYTSINQSGGPAMLKQYFDTALVGFGDIYSFFTTVGDTYAPGDTVYLGADAQTITNTAGGSTHGLGTVWMPLGGTLAGAAGVFVNILVVPQTPIQSL